MKIALLNFRKNLSPDGSGLISALLKQAEHSVKFVHVMHKQKSTEPLREILRDVDLVMIGLYSLEARKAVLFTEFIHQKYPGMKVIWGGPHCIAAPKQCLKYADGVCFAEGDQVVVELVNKMEAGKDYTDTPNMAFQVNGEPIFNKVLPPFSDLDSLPYFDYDVEDKFLCDDRGLTQMTKELLQKYQPDYPFGVPVYHIVTSRGCPHKCTYCNNCRYIAMQHGYASIRYRSIDHVIGELEYRFEHLPFFDKVAFGDDDLFTRPTEQLQRLAEQYKKKIGLPFIANVSANTYNKEKMEILVDAGMKVLQMGVQSGSQRILDEVFDRKIRVSKTLNVIRHIEPHLRTHNIQMYLDFIIDNPYETEIDILETTRYLTNLPRQIETSLYQLNFFPGTPIYERALKDGFTVPFDEKQTFRSFSHYRIMYQNNYATFLLFLTQLLRRGKFSRYISIFLVRAVENSLLRRIAGMAPPSLYLFLIRCTSKLVRKQRHRRRKKSVLTTQK